MLEIIWSLAIARLFVLYGYVLDLSLLGFNKSTCVYFLVQARKISWVLLCYLVAEKSEGLGDMITVAFW